MNKNEKKPVPISLSTIDKFLVYLKKKGRSTATTRKYAADLKAFYNFLPEEDKTLYKETLPAWRQHLISKEFAARTINTRLAACNSFLAFLKRINWQVPPIRLEVEKTVSSITREEYHLLLITAKQSNQEQLYFLVKAFCCLGLSVAELPFFTVKALVAGNIPVVTSSQTKNVYIPEILKNEFLDFAHRFNINSGVLFKSPAGEPLTRALIVKQLRDLCMEAGIPEEKGTPKIFCNLYTNTYSDIRSGSSALIDKEYSKILEAEDEIVGWESLAV